MILTKTFFLDDGVLGESVVLDTRTKGLLVENLVWREMSQLSSDCVLLVIASEYYDASYYVRDYKVFTKMADKW